MHLDPPLGFVPPHDVLELRQVEIAPEFAVDAREQVLVECGGDASGIIVRQNQRRNWLFEIGRQQQRVTFAQN